jgi:quinol monooxygenase YgiN
LAGIIELHRREGEMEGRAAMLSARALFAALLSLPFFAAAQQTIDMTPITGAFAVAYVETRGDSAAAGRAALERYRDAVGRDPGCLAVEAFAQVGRPGRFAVLETWRDQAAFEARDPEPKRELLEALRSIRISDYDERPYKALTLSPSETAGGGEASRFVISHVDVAPNTQAPQLLARLAALSRDEEGNLRFDVLQHLQRGNHFTVVEHWRTEAALDEHVEAAHTREYRDALQPLTGSPLDERVYTAIGGAR